jgi:hypothetical protein
MVNGSFRSQSSVKRRLVHCYVSVKACLRSQKPACMLHITRHLPQLLLRGDLVVVVFKKPS